MGYGTLYLGTYGKKVVTEPEAWNISAEVSGRYILASIGSHDAWELVTKS